MAFVGRPFARPYWRSAGAEEVLHSKPLEPSEAVPLGTRGIEVEVLERRRVGKQLLVGLPVIQGGLTELVNPGSLECLLHLRISPKRPRPISQHQVKLHIGPSRLPDPIHVLGARRLVVEVPRPVVRRTATG